MRAIDQSPAVVLRIGQFQIVDTHGERHLDDAADMVEVVAVQYDIEHHRVVVLFDQRGDARFQVEGLGARQKIIHFLGRILERQLDMIQSELLHPRNACFGQADAGSDQIGVIAKSMRFFDQLFQIIAQQRLAAGEPELRSAELTGLPHHVDPLRGGQFIAVFRIVQRVVAEHAMQRTTISQLGQ